MKNYKGIRLLHKYLYDKPTFEEKAKVEKWYEQIDERNHVGDNDDLLQLKEEMYQRIWHKLKPKALVVPFHKKAFFRISAAAFFAACVTSVYIFMLRSPNAAAPVAELRAPELRSDVAAPAVNKAILTLADGSTIVLDSAGIGSLAKQGSVMISKMANGKVAYKNNSGLAAEIQYNTLMVPKGSKPMQLVLADGSEVWLNVASSITYPTTFPGKERKVTITGEAYFEVMPLISRQGHGKGPFVVSVASPLAARRSAEIRVLGTHFNVSAYNDDNSLKVTLLEGSVKVGQHERSIIIKPGQQAEINQEGELELNKEIDTDQVMAWKNNWFNFNSLTVPEIMRQIERWYNTSVRYEGIPSNKHFSGIVSRSNQVSDVLKIMEQAGIKFKIEGRIITVM